MMKKIKDYCNYSQSQMLKQILENNGIQVFLKSPIGIGGEYFGEGVIYDLYVEDKDFDTAKEIIREFEKGGITLSELKKTPLYQRHYELGAKIGEFAGWELPLWYSSIIEEHNAVRNCVGVFDVSHMGELFVVGEDAQKFVNYLITNNVEKITNGKIVYSPICNKNGGILDDLLAYKFNEEKIMLVVNASNTQKDFEWVKSQSSSFNVEVINKSDEYCQIAFQGPKSQDQLQKYLKDIDLDSIEYYSFEVIRLEGEEVILSRTGYTGEDGFELYLPPKIAVKVWDQLIQLASEVDGKPCGLASRDTLRFEPKMLLYGNDMDENTTPLEAGLKWTVDFDKEFIGKEVLLKQKEEGIKRKLVGMEIHDKMPVRHGYEIYKGNEKIGLVTSGVKSPTLGKNLALGYVSKEFSKLGTIVSIKARNKLLEAEIVKTPFYKGSVKSLK
ncbi:glycine cleavage system aminomethyltransferase GcvT [Petrotoga sp. SL27]|uniref:glycine cleavage system aminomethyltransferase GcvT n=1 Tax=Petrotoga sp. SL27 TaxID=1445612 RepID=UPI000CDF18FB|nr:glycine cleavage system aminomethyltransferase GcvT [Petrotoga sp. SL27]